MEGLWRGSVLQIVPRPQYCNNPTRGLMNIHQDLWKGFPSLLYVVSIWGGLKEGSQLLLNGDCSTNILTKEVFWPWTKLHYWTDDIFCVRKKKEYILSPASLAPAPSPHHQLFFSWHKFSHYKIIFFLWINKYNGVVRNKTLIRPKDWKPYLSLRNLIFHHRCLISA